MRIITYPSDQIDRDSCENLVDHGDNQGDAIGGKEGRQLGVLVVLADHEVVITVLLVCRVVLLAGNLVTEALHMAFVRDSLLFLLRSGQAGPFNDCSRLQLFISMAFDDRWAVNRCRILV